MVRYRRFVRQIAGPCWVLVCLAGPVLADDHRILTPQEWANMSEPLTRIWFKSFCFTVVVEYLVIYSWLRWPRKAWAKLFGWVLVVNLITHPALHIFSFGSYRLVLPPPPWPRPEDAPGGNKFYATAPIFGPEYLFALELVVLAVEFLLLKRIFRRLHRNGTLDGPVSPLQTFTIAFAANAASFFFGWAGRYYGDELTLIGEMTDIEER